MTSISSTPCIVLLTVCLVLLAACEEGGGTQADSFCNETIPPVELSDRRLRVDPEQGVLRDSAGREVVMRGINVGGRSKWAPFLPFPMDPGASLEQVRSSADEHFARLPGWGLDTVRLVFSWEALEPSEGQIDEAYLDRYEAMVDAAHAHGIRVIVDFHQDIYASPFCGDGFPPWTLPEDQQGPPRHDCEYWFLKYISDDGVKEAFDRFWSDETGVKTAFKEMWTVMVNRFKDHPAVVGFEVINEPGWGSAQDVDAFKRDVLTPFHTEMAAHIRSLAPDSLVFYDNPGIDALMPMDANHYRPEGEGLVFAPHQYDQNLIGGKEWTGASPDPGLDRLAEFRDRERTPILLGEFGVAQGGEGGDGWLGQFMDAMDRHRFSATLWEYSRNEELWNMEDLSVVDVDGSERAVLDAYVRPWLRAVAGSEASFSWDPETGKAEASWEADAHGVTEIVIPRRLFPDGPAGVEVKTEGQVCHFWDAGRGELRIESLTAGSIQVTFHR